jgi:hypothetical protein
MNFQTFSASGIKQSLDPDMLLDGITLIAMGVEPSNCARVGGRPAAAPYMSRQY